MNDIHVAFVGVASSVSDKTNLDNPFNNVISPYSTDEYKKASEKLKAALDTDFDLKNKWFFDGKLRDFRFIGQDYDEAIKKIDELKNEFRADASPEIRDMITRWENIKSRLDMGRYTEDRGITVEVANEIVLILMSLNMFRK
jgi:division protein CdvB (Snf7/Vps24/ESCRT-III family)